MNRTPRVLATVVVAVLASASAACSGTTVKGASPKNWAGTVCGALTTWQSAITADTATLQGQITNVSDTTTLKADWATFLTNRVNEASALAHAIATVGQPAVPDGPAIQQTFATAVQKYLAAVQQAQTQMAAANVSDTTGFANLEQSVGGNLNNAGEQFSSNVSATTSKFKSSDDKVLSNALNSNPTCQKLYGQSGTATTQSSVTTPTTAAKH